jgi:putative hydrolase of the HAD superfamily
METQNQAVIFDMYETLVTQFCSPLYYGTQIAQDLGLAPESFLPGWRATEQERATGKRTFEEVMEMLMHHHGIWSAEKYRQVVEKRIAMQTDCFNHLHPEILPMLSTLKEKGVKIGLITNCFSEEAKLIRESVLFPYFDAPCLSYELGVRKPDPEIFHTCVKKLGIPAPNCLYVGDGGSQELETARGLGMQAVQTTWYRREDFEKYQAAIRPDFIQVSKPMKLLELLNT